MLFDRAMKDMPVKFCVGSFYNAPPQPIWLVSARLDEPRVGALFTFPN